jgi:hypothetical protein
MRIIHETLVDIKTWMREIYSQIMKFLLWNKKFLATLCVNYSKTWMLLALQECRMLLTSTHIHTLAFINISLAYFFSPLTRKKDFFSFNGNLRVESQIKKEEGKKTFKEFTLTFVALKSSSLSNKCWGLKCYCYYCCDTQFFFYSMGGNFALLLCILLKSGRHAYATRKQ